MAKTGTTTKRKQYIEIALLYKKCNYSTFRDFCNDIKERKINSLNEPQYKWIHEIEFSSFRQRFQKNVKPLLNNGLAELELMLYTPEMRYGDNVEREKCIIKKLYESGISDKDILEFFNSNPPTKRQFMQRVTDIVSSIGQSINQNTTMSSQRWITNFLKRRRNYIVERENYSSRSTPLVQHPLPPSGNNFGSASLVQYPLPPSGNNFGSTSLFQPSENSSDRHHQQYIMEYNAYQQMTHEQIQLYEARNAAHMQLLQRHTFVQQQHIDYLHRRMTQCTTPSQDMNRTTRTKRKTRVRMSSRKRLNQTLLHDEDNDEEMAEEEATEKISDRGDKTNDTTIEDEKTDDGVDGDNDEEMAGEEADNHSCIDLTNSQGGYNRNRTTQNQMILNYPFQFLGDFTNMNDIETYLTEDLAKMFPLKDVGVTCINHASYDNTRTSGDVMSINNKTMKRLSKEPARVSSKRGGSARFGNKTTMWLNDEIVNFWMKW